MIFFKKLKSLVKKEKQEEIVERQRYYIPCKDLFIHFKSSVEVDEQIAYKKVIKLQEIK